jgi:hypothetical protein
MTVKKSGKIEHMEKAHDDQVFSYLMALYVWYDGKNLANNWHIEKSTIKTDQNIELDEDPFEDALEAKEEVPLENTIYEENSSIAQALAWVEQNAKYTTSVNLKDQENDQMEYMRNNILSHNKAAREQYAKEKGLDVTMFETEEGHSFVTLPSSIYTGYDDENFNYDDEDDIAFNTRNLYDRSSVLQGNLSHLYDKV